MAIYQCFNEMTAEAEADAETGIRDPARSTRQPVPIAERKPWFRSSRPRENRFTVAIAIPKGEQTATNPISKIP